MFFASYTETRDNLEVTRTPAVEVAERGAEGAKAASNREHAKDTHRHSFPAALSRTHYTEPQVKEFVQGKLRLQILE